MTTQPFRFSRNSSAIALSVVGSLALGLSGCATKLDMGALDKSIRAGISAQVGLETAAIQCPGAPETAKAGVKFTCTAAPNLGGLLTVEVTQKDDAGNISWNIVKTEGLIDLGKLEEAVSAGLAQQRGEIAKVDCGGKFRAAKQGESFDCKVAGESGETTVTVTPKDDEGNVRWAVAAADESDDGGADDAESEEPAESELPPH